ncbi:MAG: hypothetical protein MUP70_17685 [Candidatus Aminicenantes bacterium]|nr:hypothetical protein [Candidatus Aminicenantes bacterium]
MYFSLSKLDVQDYDKWQAEFFLNSDLLKEALKRSGVEHLSSEYLELINKDVT